MDANQNQDREQRGGESRLDFTTGDDARNPAKFGQPRRETDGNAAYEAQVLNNADPGDLEPLELLDGRCPVDGLPAGNCAHFPGDQVVLNPDGTSWYEGKGFPPGTFQEDGNAPEAKAGREGGPGGKEPRRS